MLSTLFKVCIGMLLLAVISCSSNTANKTQTIDNIKPVELSEPELLIDFEQDGLVQPRSIELLENNKLAILDGKLNEVFIFSEEGEFQQRFGGKGKGPGEAQRPLFLDASAEYINVIDAGLYRINQFDYNGELSESFSFQTNPYDGRLTILGDSKYAAGSMGKDSSLVKIVDVKSDSTIYFGEAMGSTNFSPSLENARQTLANGEIPELYKISVILSSNDEHIYAYLEMLSRLQKYTLKGELLWDTEINLSLNDKIFQRAVQRAKDSPEAAVPTFPYISSMKVVNGDIFLLWMPVENEPRKLVRVSSDGAVKNIYHVPEESPTYSVFTVNPENNMIYFCAPQMGQIYRTKLPD